MIKDTKKDMRNGQDFISAPNFPQISLSYSVVQPSVLIHLDSFIEKNSIPINFKSQTDFLLI